MVIRYKKGVGCFLHIRFPCLPSTIEPVVLSDHFPDSFLWLLSTKTVRMTIQEISAALPAGSQSSDEKIDRLIVVDTEFVDNIDPKEERAFVGFPFSA